MSGIDHTFRVYMDIDATGEWSVTCPRVCEFPDVTLDQLRPLKCVTELNEIAITFDYPLSQPVTRTFTSITGFSTYDLWGAIYAGYTKIYDEEEAAAGDPGRIPGMMNRAKSNGPHGIWGHVMSDLFIEGVTEVAPGKFELAIGS